MDPLSVLGAADTIVSQANRILEVVDAARTNTKKCRALGERVRRLQQVAQDISRRENQGRLSSIVLKNVMTVMESVEESVKKYSRLNRARRLVFAVHIEAEFTELNNALDSVLQGIHA